MSTNVLVVDSDPESSGFVGDLLKARYPEIEIIEANDGEVAIDLLTQHGDYVDAIVLGTELPTTDGWELLYVIKDKDNWPEVPVVIMITEHSMWEDSLKAHTIGANHFVSKPIDNEELFAVLDNLFDEV